MKVLGIFAFFFGYTLVYAGVSRIQGHKNNSILALLGFKSGTAGDLIDKMVSAASSGVAAGAAGGLAAGGGDQSAPAPAPSPGGSTGGNGGSFQPIPNYSGNPISGPPIITGV